MTEAPYPPAENPADGDRPGQPRYSASASVPVPPAPGPGQGQGPASYSSAPGPGGATYGGMPGSPFSQGAQFGQPQSPPPMGQPPAGQPPMGQAPMGQAPMGQAPMGQPPMGQSPVGQPPSGQARASASVPQAPPGGPYGSAPPQFGNPPGGSTYGQPAPSTYGSAPGGYAGPSGAPAGGSMFGQPAPAPAPSAPPAPSGPPPGGTYGSPQGQGGYGAGPSGGYAPAPSSYPQDRSAGTYGQARSGDGEWPNPTTERKPKRGLIIALIVTAVLVVIGVGGYVGWSMKNGDADYSVGACVQQQGTEAAIVDCGTAGAFKITSIVDAENGCPEPNRPSLVLTKSGSDSKQYACLEPAS